MNVRKSTAVDEFIFQLDKATNKINKLDPDVKDKSQFSTTIAELLPILRTCRQTFKKLNLKISSDEFSDENVEASIERYLNAMQIFKFVQDKSTQEKAAEVIGKVFTEASRLADTFKDLNLGDWKIGKKVEGTNKSKEY